jgi:hypothetical protein
VEPRRVSAPTLLLGALCAYPAAWLIRGLVVDAGWPSLEWMIASKAGDLGALSGWAPHAMAAEMILTVVLGLCWARWFLGPQRQ